MESKHEGASREKAAEEMDSAREKSDQHQKEETREV